MNFVFAFDVSLEAVKSGFTSAACTVLSKCLYGEEAEDGSMVEPCFPQESQICILSFDRSLHFYDLSVRHFSLLVSVTLIGSS